MEFSNRNETKYCTYVHCGVFAQRLFLQSSARSTSQSTLQSVCCSTLWVVCSIESKVCYDWFFATLENTRWWATMNFVDPTANNNFANTCLSSKLPSKTNKTQMHTSILQPWRRRPKAVLQIADFVVHTFSPIQIRLDRSRRWILVLFWRWMSTDWLANRSRFAIFTAAWAVPTNCEMLLAPVISSLVFALWHDLAPKTDQLYYSTLPARPTK